MKTPLNCLTFIKHGHTDIKTRKIVFASKRESQKCYNEMIKRLVKEVCVTGVTEGEGDIYTTIHFLNNKHVKKAFEMLVLLRSLLRYNQSHERHDRKMMNFDIRETKGKS